MSNGLPHVILDLGDIERLLIELAEHGGRTADLCNDAAYLISKTVIPENRHLAILEAARDDAEDVVDAIAKGLGVVIEDGMTMKDAQTLLLDKIEGLKAEAEDARDELLLMQIGDSDVH